MIPILEVKYLKNRKKPQKASTCLIPCIDILESVKLEEQRWDQQWSGPGSRGGLDHWRAAWGGLGRWLLHLNVGGGGYTALSIGQK